jgi:hypothetical protein
MCGLRGREEQWIGRAVVVVKRVRAVVGRRRYVGLPRMVSSLARDL